MLHIQRSIGFILLFVGIQSFSQGLTTEKAFNANYNQLPQQILVDDTTTYLLIRQSYSGSGSQPSLLQKIDTDGNVLFEVMVEPETGDFMLIDNMIMSEDEGLYLAGTSWGVCDVPNPLPFVQKYDSEGEVVWTWLSHAVGENLNLSGFSLIENTDLTNKLVYSISQYSDIHAPSTIYMAGTDGALLDSIDVTNNRFDYFETIDDDELIASKMDSLFTFNFDGDILHTRKFNENIQQLATIGDTLMVLTKDSLFYLDTDFSTIEGITFEEDLRNFRLYEDELLVHGSAVSEQHIYTLNYDLTTTSTLTVPAELPGNIKSHFSDEQLSIAIPFALTKYQAVRYLNFSLTTAADIPLKRTDAGIADIEILDREFNDWDEVNLYTKVLLKNYGTEELTSCRINHYVKNHLVCGLNYYTTVFTDLSILPGESEWIELGWTGFKPIVNIFAGPGEPAFNYCFYTSYVNELCDLNVPNDGFCRDLDGQLSLDANAPQAELEIYPNPFNATFTVKNLPQAYSTFTIYNMVGKAMLAGTTSGEINAGELPAGVYMAVFSGDNVRAVNQLVVKE